MSITLKWSSTDIESANNNKHQPKQKLHATECNANSSDKLQQAIGLVVDKAASLLHTNINADSMYLLFAWNTITAKLSIVVTDVSKSQDSQHIVQCQFPLIAQEAQNKAAQTDSQSLMPTTASNIEYYLRDHLSTCKLFLNYSLVAAWYINERDNCKLL